MRRCHGVKLTCADERYGRGVRSSEVDARSALKVASSHRDHASTSRGYGRGRNARNRHRASGARPRIGSAGGTEHDVNPVVALLIVAGRESTARIEIYTIGSGGSICDCVQRGIIGAGCEVRTGKRVVAVGSVVGSDVDGVGGDSDGRREHNLLPAGGCFVGEGGAGEQRAGRAP